MKTLIVAATLFEIQPFIDQQQKYLNVDFLISGVGMTQTAYSLGKHLAFHDYDLLINVGIAGSFDKNLEIGDVVSVTQDTFSELGAEDDSKFISIDQLGFGNSSYTPKQSISTTELLKKITSGTAITVNKVHGNENSINKLLIQYPNTTIESMEGAAFFLVANQEQKEAIQIRGISNYVEKRNRATWNISLAIKNSNAVLFQILDKLYS